MPGLYTGPTFGPHFRVLSHAYDYIHTYVHTFMHTYRHYNYLLNKYNKIRVHNYTYKTKIIKLLTTGDYTSAIRNECIMLTCVTVHEVKYSIKIFPRNEGV